MIALQRRGGVRGAWRFFGVVGRALSLPAVIRDRRVDRDHPVVEAAFPAGEIARGDRRGEVSKLDRGSGGREVGPQRAFTGEAGEVRRSEARAAETRPLLKGDRVRRSPVV